MAINKKRIAATLLAVLLGLQVSYCLSQPSENSEPELVGLTSFNKLYRDYFVAALYHSEGQIDSTRLIDSDKPKRMVMVISADEMSARKFRMEWGAAIEINNNGHIDYRQVALKGGGLDEFLALPKYAPEGKLTTSDIITIELLRSKRSGNLNTLIKYNDEVMIARKGGALFRVLLRCWIGKRPPTEAFKRQLLGHEQIRNYEELLFYLRSATRTG